MAALFIALIFTALSYILSYGLYLWVLRPLQANSFNPDATYLNQLYNFTDSVVLFAFNPLAFFYASYRTGPWLDFQSNSDYFDLAKYALVGGALGFLAGFTGEVFMALGAFGAQYVFPGLGALDIGSYALSAAQAAVEATLIMVAAVALRHLKDGVLLAAGKGPEPAQHDSSVDVA